MHALEQLKDAYTQYRRRHDLLLSLSVSCKHFVGRPVQFITRVIGLELRGGTNLF